MATAMRCLLMSGARTTPDSSLHHRDARGDRTRDWIHDIGASAAMGVAHHGQPIHNDLQTGFRVASRRGCTRILLESHWCSPAGVHNSSLHLRQVDEPGQEHPERMADSAQPKSMAIPLAAFAAGAVVALLVGVFGKVHDPTLADTTTLGFRTVIDMKVALAVALECSPCSSSSERSGSTAGWAPRPLPGWVGHTESPAHSLSCSSSSSPTTVCGRSASSPEPRRMESPCERARSCTAYSAAPSSGH